jgi:hypothetical protein
MKRQLDNASLGYSDTPLIPGTGWHVHDGTRPQPPVVTPGVGAAPPSDAEVLFDGSSLSAWKAKAGGPAPWRLGEGWFEVVPGSGNLQTRGEFGSLQLHLEFACPADVRGNGQGRGNSGLFLMGLYEIQVLDSYENPTYADGTAGGLYGQFPPLVNPIRRPGEWNTYDAVWEAPRFQGDRLESPAVLTLLFNGVVVHAHTRLLGIGWHKTAPAYKPHPPAGPIELQDHKDPVRFRNIWVRELKGYDE